MNIISTLLTNASFATRYLKLLTLLPALLAFVQAFEHSDASGAEKKKQVLFALNRTTDLLEQRGFLTAEMNTGIDALAAELIDVIVESFNAVGIFKRSRAVV